MTTDISVAPQKPPAPKRAPFYTSMFFWLLVAIVAGIVIGAGGERLKRIGSEARQELERLWGAKVFLELWVKVRSGWADDEAHLRSFGYE